VHVAIELALIPVVLLKAGSIGWRFLKYDRADRACVWRLGLAADPRAPDADRGHDGPGGQRDGRLRQAALAARTCWWP
jgi:hypothetical protein